LTPDLNLKSVKNTSTSSPPPIPLPSTSNFVAAGGNVGNTNFFGAGFFNSTGATAAYQVANVGTPPHILQQIAAQDAYARSLDSLLPMYFSMLLGGPGVRLNNSQANILKYRDRRNRQPRGSALIALFRPLQFIVDAIAAVTSSGVHTITRGELGDIGYNLPALANFINTVGKPRYEFELDRLRQHDDDVERFNERLEAMSSGVGGF